MNINSRTAGCSTAMDKLAICVGLADINGIAHWWYFAPGSHSRPKKSTMAGLETVNDIDDRWYHWKQLFIFILDEHVPLKTVKCRWKQVPWISEETREMIRNYLWKKQRTVAKLLSNVNSLHAVSLNIGLHTTTSLRGKPNNRLVK